MVPAALDHIILLLPYALLFNPPSWITDNFTLTPGGRHADGKTENKLIVFRDGTYIELIAFIDDDPKHRQGHWWRDKPYGIIDYALTSSDVKDIDGVRERISQDEKASSLGIQYANAIQGGRKRPDGQEVKWHVTFPHGVPRGSVAFFCHDITPRGLRVPKETTATTHPCGAIGIGRVTIQVKPETLSPFVCAYSAITNAPAGLDMTVLDLITPIPAARGMRSPQLCVVEMPMHEYKTMEVEEISASVSEIALLTDTAGLKWSREPIEQYEKGFRPIVIRFLHARQTLK